MVKTRKVKTFIIINLAIIFALVSFFMNILASPIDPSSKMQEKLKDISDEEKKVLQNLFALMNETKEMEEEEKGLTRDIEILNKEINGLETEITAEEKKYEEKLNVLRQVLQIYQRKGPGSYLEIILNSENLNMFLWRISTLQDLSRNTEKLLKSIEDSKGKLSEKKAEITQKFALIKNKQEQLKESLDKKLQLKKEMEKYIASLSQQKEHYLEQLSNLQQAWNKLKLLLYQSSDEFSRIIKDSDLPLDAVNMTFSFKGIEGVVDEKTFNRVISGNPHFSDISFSFHPGKAQISVPKMNLVLTGTFDILGGSTLRFMPEDGSFYGISLEPETIKELFKGGYLELDFKPLIGENKLTSVEIMEGSLKFMIKPVF